MMTPKSFLGDHSAALLPKHKVVPSLTRGVGSKERLVAGIKEADSSAFPR